MKINYNNTALNFLDQWPTDVYFPKEMVTFKGVDIPSIGKYEIIYKLKHIWNDLSNLFKSEVRYITSPFLQAFEKSADKLQSVIHDIEYNNCGTFIIPYAPFLISTIFYYVNGGKFFFMLVNNERGIKRIDLVLSSDNYLKINATRKDYYDKKLAATFAVNNTLLMIAFIKFCDLDTKVISAQKKDIHIGVKYVNETNRNVTIMDSTWFTTIVRSEGFGVRSHLRWQVCGPNNSERKLILVPSHEKHGYTRKATILRNDNL